MKNDVVYCLLVSKKCTFNNNNNTIYLFYLFTNLNETKEYY